MMGLKNSHNNDATLTKIARCVMALPLLPHEHIEHVYKISKYIKNQEEIKKLFNSYRMANKTCINYLISCSYKINP